MKKPFEVIIGITVVVIITGGFSALHHLWIGNIFFSTAAGLLTSALIIWIFSEIRRRKFFHGNQENPHALIVNAISEVARGNFDVILNPDSLGPHNEMAEAFNNMARDLGDLETMRQDFISNVSHEIQSPLTNIKGFAALLKDDSLSAKDRQHYAGIIEAESERLSALSDNLLKLTALDSEKKPLYMQAFRLDKQIQQVALTLEPQWSKKNINIEADLARCEYSGDAELLNHVWVNLIHNAVKFTPENGDIRITLKADTRSVTVIISDNGAGIAESDRLHIFERFYKADKSRGRAAGGSGLGLSIVKKIVDMHGGDVSADSEPGRGSKFTVRLPSAE